MDPSKRYLIDTPDGPMTRGDAAKRYGIPKGTLIRRIWSGWPQEKWFEPSYRPQRRPNPPAKRRGRFVTPYGRKSLTEMATILGMSFNGLRARLYVVGWTQEEAFNTPPHGVAGKHFVMPPEEYIRRRTAALEADYAERAKMEHQRRVAYNTRRKAKRVKEKDDD